ncbi:MAG: molybdate ABC transporter substrate-binding protein [Alphaproteobacteria bacterium]|nr:molybdate ABC transporter substrate-binding protein [Alphaproteobacteria bacterium]TAD91179.1 MAG: molybdate ABC transporter substrate-binding protein [Alphaproteobacteria bacterium]
MISWTRLAAAAAVILPMVAGVAAVPAAAQSTSNRPVLVFAAASLQTALNAIARDWQTAAGGRVTFSYAASSALARQLEQGAPADLFATADLDWMDWAQQRNLIDPATRRHLLGNSLVLIGAADTPTSLTIAPGFGLREALGDSRLATGDPRSVPAGRYAQAALTSLGIWDTVSHRLAGVDNVRTALALVARGEARLGIVYLTDARTEPRVQVIGTFPATSHPPIIYPFALTRTGGTSDAARFFEFLSGPAGVRVFEAEGFTILR